MLCIGLPIPLTIRTNALPEIEFVVDFLIPPSAVPIISLFIVFLDEHDACEALFHGAGVEMVSHGCDPVL